MGVDTFRNWFDASAYCNERGGYLGSVHSSEENRWVFELLRLYDWAGRDVWIGLNDVTVDGTMEWIDGSSNDFTQFAVGRPASATDNCVVYSANRNGYWYDVPCTLGLQSMCKYNETLSVASPGMGTLYQYTFVYNPETNI